MTAGRGALAFVRSVLDRRMNRFGRSSRVLLVLAYAAVVAVSGAGPRVLCLGDDGAVSILARPDSGCCESEEVCVDVAPPERSASDYLTVQLSSCPDCIDVLLAGGVDQVNERGPEGDRSLEACCFAALPAVDCRTISLNQSDHPPGPLNPPHGSPPTGVSTTVLRC